MALLDKPEYVADLRSEMTNVAIGEKWGTSEKSVRRAKKVLEIAPAPKTTKAALIGGESEDHAADGTANYVRFSQEPWGFDQYREFIRSTGQDPDKVTFTWGWTSNPAGGCWNKLNNVKPIASAPAEFTVDLPALYAAARNATPKPSPAPTGRATVVVWADPQIGKTGRRGGTPELIERSNIIREKLAAELTKRQPERILIADGGDGIEGFESGGNPMFTNDLSLAGQLDLYGTELFEWINVCHKHAPVTVMGVPSNHAAWRSGKQTLGIPADDLGLFMHKQVSKRTEDRGMDVDWVTPAPYDESVAVEFAGTRVGLVHGNQFGAGQAISWWEKQAFGAGACASADVLISAHYHSFGAGVAGRNPHNNRQRWWLGAPTLDNGSDWFRQTAGRDSDPGLLVFDVTADGFDLSSLTIL
ncbi:hypothetical protein ASC66_01200 [Leifsonia sp. Root4]|uniref:hypothetical protein n=1 Tax=Leifsonia sp. Root4 TaxID=1736525 RepID=UPI0006F387E2|nr:hypothetical protein [Leifsonia sp. Root4]KQW07645.1 hypothetical protein ASC66_01200 [Leifsonia sp. Root4]